MKRIADLYKMDKYQILREVLGVKEDGYYTEEYINQLESKFKLLVDLKDTAGEDLNKLYDMLNEEFRETFRMLSYLRYLRYEAEQQ